MSSHAFFAYRTSAGLHAAALAAGLALSSWSSPVHVHLTRGDTELLASFSLPQPSDQQLPPILFSPSELPAEPAQTKPVELSPSVTELRRQQVPAELLLAQAVLPKLPAEMEACDCPAHEQPATTPKRESATPAPTRTTTAAELPARRPQEVPKFSVSTAVTLPASATVSGAEVDEPPRKIATNRPPPYPADAYQRRLQGRVVLEVHVNAQGAVESLSVLESSGVASFDQSALDTVRFWRFEPARRLGQSVAAVVHVPIRFELGSR